MMTPISAFLRGIIRNFERRNGDHAPCLDELVEQVPLLESQDREPHPLSSMLHHGRVLQRAQMHMPAATPPIDAAAALGEKRAFVELWLQDVYEQQAASVPRTSPQAIFQTPLLARPSAAGHALLMCNGLPCRVALALTVVDEKTGARYVWSMRDSLERLTLAVDWIFADERSRVSQAAYKYVAARIGAPYAPAVLRGLKAVEHDSGFVALAPLFLRHLRLMAASEHRPPGPLRGRQVHTTLLWADLGPRTTLPKLDAQAPNGARWLLLAPLLEQVGGRPGVFLCPGDSPDEPHHPRLQIDDEALLVRRSAILNLQLMRAHLEAADGLEAST